MSYLRGKDQWDYKIFEDSGVLGDVNGGFSAGGTLTEINAKFTEKLIIYLALEEKGKMLGKQWMMWTMLILRPHVAGHTEIALGTPRWTQGMFVAIVIPTMTDMLILSVDLACLGRLVAGVELRGVTMVAEIEIIFAGNHGDLA